MINEHYMTPLRETIKRYVPISNVAEIFGISRPTLYMFMQNYDDGELTNIPENIREFFNLIKNNPQPEEIKVYLKMRGVSDIDGKPIKIKEFSEKQENHFKLMKEITSIDKMMDNINRLIAERKSMIMDAEREIVVVNSLIRQNPDNCTEYLVRRDALRNRINKMETEIGHLKEEYDLLTPSQKFMMRKISEYENGNVTGGWNIDDGLMTMCAGNNGKSMIIFRLSTKDVVEPEFTVSLYIDSPVGEMLLATYEPESDKSFVLIEDILPTIHPQYEVTCRYQNTEVKTRRYPLRFR